MFTKIQEAYEILQDDKTREAYDNLGTSPAISLSLPHDLTPAFTYSCRQSRRLTFPFLASILFPHPLLLSLPPCLPPSLPLFCRQGQKGTGCKDRGDG